MNEKKKQALKKKLAEVPNPAVPNRAHTEMKADNKNENKNQAQNKSSQNCNNKYPPVKTGGISFSGIALNTTSYTQVR